MSKICGFSKTAAGYQQQHEAIADTMLRCMNYEGDTFGKAAVGGDIVFGSSGEPAVVPLFGQDFYVLFDGCIYNKDELRASLKQKKYDFFLGTDAEMLVYLYLEMGSWMAKHINGVFAIAIYDPFKRETMLVRDQFGIKPLFYTVKNDTLIFASEIKALLTHPEIENKAVLDNTGLSEIFALGPAKTSTTGVFKSIEQVGPAQSVVFSGGNIQTRTIYWKFTAGKHLDSYEQTVETVRGLLTDAIQRQMDFHKRQCSLLSGGLDSSVVTAIGNEIYKRQTGESLKTISFDYTDNDKYFVASSFQPEMDAPWAIKTSEALGTNHEFLFCGYEELADALYTAVDRKDLPGMADVDSSLLHFCGLVTKEYDLALTGECSDEIFGGYPWYRDAEAITRGVFPWSKDFEARALLLSDELLDKIDIPGYANDKFAKTVADAPLLEDETPEQQQHRQLFYLNIKWFMQTLIDRMGVMGGRLDAKVPFCDIRLVQYLYNIPWEMKYKDGVVKGLLRDAGQGLLPEDILRRKKSPFPKTYHPNYEKLLGERLLAVLEDQNAPIRPFVNHEKAKAFIASPKDYGKPWYGQLMAGPQMLAYLLQVNYWLDKYHIIVK